MPQMCSICQIKNNVLRFAFSRIYRIVTPPYTEVSYHYIFYRQFYVRRDLFMQGPEDSLFKNLLKWNLYCDNFNCLRPLSDIMSALLDPQAPAASSDLTVIQNNLITSGSFSRALSPNTSCVLLYY